MKSTKKLDYERHQWKAVGYGQIETCARCGLQYKVGMSAVCQAKAEGAAPGVEVQP